MFASMSSLDGHKIGHTEETANELNQNPMTYDSDRIASVHRAPVAQLDRASAFEAEGRGFDSLQARHFPL